MGLFRDKKLGSRTLRLGDSGPDVRQLHDFLRLQGYELGEENNYGYLTKDAVRQFQKEHGLVADGIAGTRFFALILGEDLPIRRRVHMVQPQESIEQIAAQYGVDAQAFGLSSHGRAIYPGQCLVFFDREIWGIYSPKDKVSIPEGALTGLVCSEVPGQGSILPCIVRPNSGQNLDVVALHSLLRSPKRRKETAQTYLQAVTNAQGLYLPWQAVAALDGARYLKFLKRLRRHLTPGKQLWVELGPQVPPWRLWGGIDYQKVNELVDRVIITPQRESIECSAIETLIEAVSPVYSWKILLKLAVYAEEWEITESHVQTVRLAYGTALSRAHRHGARLERDEQGRPYYRYQRKGIQFQIRLPQLSAMGKIAALANRHNLAGLLLDELGMEDPRIWEQVRSHFHPASFIFSKE